MKWSLVKGIFENNDKNNLNLKLNNYTFSYNSEESTHNEFDNDFWILIDGFVLPTYTEFDKYKSLSQYELIKQLFIEHKQNLVNYIKGSYTIIIFNNPEIYIFNDFHSIKKFFIYNNNIDLTISNTIDFILTKNNPTIDNYQVAMYCIMEHFVNGATMYENVKYSNPATFITINTQTNKVDKNHYFNPIDLIKQEKTTITLNDFASDWNSIISQYIKFLKPKDISLTITGGNDSRMILASLLHDKVPANLFTFGDPNSFDGFVAKKIATKTNYTFNNYFYNNITKNWFDKYSQKILKFGNTLINIHRAHRLHAIEQEKEIHKDTEMLFSGFMGGDYVKGLIYDDYITPQFLREYEHGEHAGDIEKCISESLEKHHFNKELININKLTNIIKELPFINAKTLIERQFLTLFYLVGSAHDWQDTTVFASKIPYVVNPFMDIDFLKLLYKSKYSFLSVNNDFLYKKLRLGRSSFHITITNTLAPELSNIEYSKKGYYTANEYLKLNPIHLLIKRYLRLKKQKNFKQSFPYKNWFVEYINEQLKLMEKNNFNLFNVDKLKYDLNKLNVFPTTEGTWHKFSNAVNIFKNTNK